MSLKFSPVTLSKRIVNSARFLIRSYQENRFKFSPRLQRDAWPRKSSLRKRPYYALCLGTLEVTMSELHVLSYPFSEARPYTSFLESKKLERARKMVIGETTNLLDAESERRLGVLLTTPIPRIWRDVCVGLDADNRLVVRDGLHRLSVRVSQTNAVSAQVSFVI